MFPSAKSSSKWTLAVLLPLLQACGTAYAAQRIVLHAQSSLVTARMDPIVSHDAISQHAHHIVGGSNFKSKYDPIGLSQSQCSNLGIHADKSNYWQPVVYQRLTNGSYIGMRTNTRIYYEQPNTKAGVKVEPFPQNFGMVAGDASRKTLDPGDQAQILQMYYCEMRNAANAIIYRKETHSMPTEPCDIIVAKTWFPTCWNGKPWDRNNPKAHVTYPLFGAGFKGPNCPGGFERRLISIHMETYYWRNNNVPKPASGQPQFILANGDTTGYGLHADFTNGWNTTVLTNMINNCKTVPVEEPPEQACAALKPSADRSKGDKCHYQNNIPDEEVGYTGAIKYLPGCNLPWASGPKPTCNPKVFKGNPGWIKPPADAFWP